MTRSCCHNESSLLRARKAQGLGRLGELRACDGIPVGPQRLQRCRYLRRARPLLLLEVPGSVERAARRTHLVGSGVRGLVEARGGDICEVCAAIGLGPTDHLLPSRPLVDVVAVHPPTQDERLWRSSRLARHLPCMRAERSVHPLPLDGHRTDELKTGGRVRHGSPRAEPTRLYTKAPPRPWLGPAARTIAMASPPACRLATVHERLPQQRRDLKSMTMRDCSLGSPLQPPTAGDG